MLHVVGKVKCLLGSADRLLRPSAVEHRPTDRVSKSLIVEDGIAYRLGELLALPTALESASKLTLAFWRSGTHCFDGVSSSTELVRGDVCDDRRLPGSVGGIPCCANQVSGRAHGMAAYGAGLHHHDFATRPRAGLFDGLTRSRVVRPNRLEVVQHVLGARGRPQRQEPMVGVRECSPASDGNEAGVAVFGEDHGCTRPVTSAQRIVSLRLGRTLPIDEYN